MTIDTTNGGGELDRPSTDQDMPEDALVRWAYAADRAYQIAHKLQNTSFIPNSMRGKAGDITAAILAGDELGLPPMAALRSIDVIQGTPGLRAHAMRGLVQSMGHKVQLVESDDTRCVMRGRRKDDPDDEWQTITWTIERAQQLGVTEKNPQWKKQPTSMLVARATGEICRLIASDVLHAMPYASEELDGGGMSDGAAQVPRVTVRELAPDAPEAQPQQPAGESGEARTELPEDDPWYVRPSDNGAAEGESETFEDAR